MDATTGLYVTLLGFLTVLGAGCFLPAWKLDPRPRTAPAGARRCPTCDRPLPPVN